MKEIQQAQIWYLTPKGVNEKREVSAKDVSLFYAYIVGTIQGLTRCGHQITAVEIDDNWREQLNA